MSKKNKEFKLSSWSISNKSTVAVITFIVLLGGFLSYTSMPRENYPEIIVPQIYVATPYPGNSALDVEKLITKRLEKEINAITGVDKITSTSIQGFSSINVEFNFDISPSDALQKVKNKVDIAMADKDFPKDLPAEPSITETNFNEQMPIMNINLSGDFSMDQLKDYAEYLEDEIEELTEISGVDIRGVQEKELEVAIDLYKMQASKISFNDIENAIVFENQSISSGDILENGIRRNVRVTGEFKDPLAIKDIVVKHENGQIVFLRDIADVEFKEQEKQSYAREYTQPVVMLDVKKRSGQNLLKASAKIDEIIAKAKSSVFPESLIISKTNDQSNDTRTMVADLENSIILGVILVVTVLYFFLGFRNALFVGIAIPLSMFLSFIILNFLGVTLNTMVLFSLVIALGMLVDNGIVVVENVYRLMDEGMPKIQAAKQGVGEVAWPIIASTATTLAAFLPLIMWDGIIGKFMQWLPITLIIVLSSSLFVALVINPMLISLYMKVVKKENKVTLINKLEGIYEKFLAFALRGKNPYSIVFGSFMLLFTAAGLMYFFPPKVLFFPNTEAKQVFVFVEYPIGTDIEETNTLSLRIEKDIETHLKKYEIDGENFLVTSIIGQVGEGTADPSKGQTGGNTPNKARITVDFVKFQDRLGVSSEQVLNDIRNVIKGYPGVSIVVDKPADGPPTGSPVNLEIKGDDYTLILKTANQLKSFINTANIPGIEELKLDIDQGKPELLVNVDRQKARRLGVSTGLIGNNLRTALYGKEISTFKDFTDDYPINIRLKEEYRYNRNALLNQKITFRDQGSGRIKQVPISAVATTQNNSSFSAVKRIDLDRVVTVYSNVLNGYNPTDVNDKIRALLNDFEIPKGLEINFTGEQEKQAKEMAFLSKALLIAVLLIFLILVGQFNSATTPIIISISVFLSLIGVLFGLLIFRMDFVILMTMIGIISLAGIVVNNAIVLIDYINLIIDRKRKTLNLDGAEQLTSSQLLECIVEGGKTRLRPVLLTAMTTILGLLPLALGININFKTLITELNPNFYIGGENVAFWGPMGWAIIYGLSFATFLTLVVVPILYYLINKIKTKGVNVAA
ncbi:copper transporter [Formosa sp. Hel3_A1_48]|uniref:efflux RND transporter permease subunit n=1 Tax=Formosa sp. Hel3_A1_48 TaxID=1336795 RepID=UPI00084E23F7|nr:efflux RND transporter permease subunit [Formosa sp. Hel3_A1_48]AOR26511.1 copper transporter [Formosa sp. Hel3_A1_48]